MNQLPSSPYTPVQKVSAQIIRIPPPPRSPLIAVVPLIVEDDPKEERNQGQGSTTFYR